MEDRLIILIASFIVAIGEKVGNVKKMQPYIVDGYYARIEDVPYSAYIGVQCSFTTEPRISAWICSGSVLNQAVILTAGHCLYPCSMKSNITVSVGHVHLLKGYQSSVYSFIINKYYDDYTAAYDLALMRLRTSLTLSPKVNRVAVMSDPPYGAEAIVTGWGLIDERTPQSTEVLKYTKQYVVTRSKCLQTFGSLPDGTICARHASGFAAVGDSGGPLVVQGYIQIGIVSYKLEKMSTSLVVYTDVGFYYHWIEKHARRIMRCKK